MRSQAKWINDSIAKTRLASEVCAGIEIRSLTHSKSSSNDTHHFKAHIYVDGVKVMRVENDGRGGNNYYHRTCTEADWRNDMWRTKAECEDKLIASSKHYCQTEKWYDHEEIRASEESNETVDTDYSYVDIAVGSLINEQLTTKEMSKALRNRIHIIDRDANSGKGLLYATDKRATDIQLANAEKAIFGIGKQFDYILVNNLDETTQLKLWLTIA